MEQFVNSDNKEKEKKIWIEVNCRFYRRKKFTINDFNVFNDCKTLEDIQKKLDEKVKEAKPNFNPIEFYTCFICLVVYLKE